jgi:hypothetical protein
MQAQNDKYINTIKSVSNLPAKIDILFQQVIKGKYSSAYIYMCV